MLADYRFFKVAHGKSAFAWVQVEAVNRPDGQFTVADDTTGELHTITKQNHPEWINAALNGCRRAAAWLGTMPWAHGFDIRLKKVQVTLADSRSDAVECAAFLATAKALCRDEYVHIDFDGAWKVIASGGGHID